MQWHNEMPPPASGTMRSFEALHTSSIKIHADKDVFFFFFP